MFVPNFKILGQVVAEKSLTEKKFTDRQTNTQTLGQKRQKLYTPYILRIPVYRGYNKAKKKIVVFQVPCQKKTGSVGRLYFFFFLFFFFFR